MDCDHRWERLPVVDFSARYVCKSCGMSDSVLLIFFPPPHYGDRVIGKIHGGKMKEEQ